ncbi:hypothetical protein V7793_02780 [Streptomyces sp. KLMMK]|uniref:hypothetical protein n=1 Tax=Streptomyces sp. KLMMK TaxID=3109353 RepID=UPI002FFE680C
MILDRINLMRRLVAALGDALFLAHEAGAQDHVLEFRALRIAASRDLGEITRNAFTNGGISEAEAQAAMRPIYSAQNEMSHSGV